MSGLLSLQKICADDIWSNMALFISVLIFDVHHEMWPQTWPWLVLGIEDSVKENIVNRELKVYYPDNDENKGLLLHNHLTFRYDL